MLFKFRLVIRNLLYARRMFHVKQTTPNENESHLENLELLWLQMIITPPHHHLK
jgi:hypothetical protein